MITASQRNRCLEMLERLRVNDSYFCRGPGLPDVKFAFTNYGVLVGLQAITHVMACSSHFTGHLLRDYCSTSSQEVQRRGT